MNASGHDGLDQGSKVLILDSALPGELVVDEPRSGKKQFFNVRTFGTRIRNMFAIQIVGLNSDFEWL